MMRLPVLIREKGVPDVLALLGVKSFAVSLKHQLAPDWKNTTKPGNCHTTTHKNIA
jgi:hypothetical protein